MGQPRKTSRYTSIRSSQERVRDRYPEIGTRLDELQELSDDQYDQVREILGVSQLFNLDLLLLSLAARSADVIDAFTYALDRWNISTASALVRLQVDNVLRAHVAAIYPDPDQLFLHLAADKRFDKLEVPEALLKLLPDAPKKARFTDRVLVELAQAHHSWIADVYKTSSAWVHHSAAHVLTTWQISDSGEVAGRFPVDINLFEPDFLAPIADAMIVSTKTLVAYLDSWKLSKLGLRNREEQGES